MKPRASQAQSPRRTLAIISRLVPPAQRISWLREWDAEFSYYLRADAAGGGRRGRLWLLTHLGAALRHAMWLRRTSLGQSSSGAGAPQLMADVAGDVRYAIRGCLRSPAFSLTVVLTLTVGLGLASAIFAFADGYLFRPLPFPGGDRTYYVDDTDSMIGGGLRSADAAVLRNSPLAGLGFVEWGVARTVGGEFVINDRRIDVLPYEVSPGFRGILRLPLVAGRDFTPDDHVDQAPLVCWLSHAFWQREFGSSRDVIGRTYRVESWGGAAHDVRVVGVLGPEVASFDLNNPPPDLVVPQQGAPLVGSNRFAFPLVLLPPDMSAAQAAQRIAAALQAGAPAGKPRTIKLSSLESSQLAGGKPTARLFFAGALLVLILASMNLVHLLLSRSTARAPEVATRAALASRWRVVRLFLTESLVLGTIGIGAGLGLGKLLSAVIAARVPQFPTAGRNLSMVPMLFDGRVIGFAIAMGLVVTVVGGLWPGWRALRRSMHQGARSSTGLSGPVSHRLARVMLASELTVATVVLVGAMFMGLGIHRYLAQPVGFDYVDRLRVGVSAPDGKPLMGADLGAIVRAMRSMPGVAAAGLDSVSDSREPIEVPGAAIDAKNIQTSRVPPDFDHAWGMAATQGRWFDETEFARDAEDVVVIDARMARIGWPDANPIGRWLRVGNATRQVIGVVPSRKSMLDREPATTVYLPIRESEARAPIVVWAPGWSGGDLSTRLAASVATTVPGARATVVPVSFERLFARSAGEAQFQAPIMGAFGVLAIVVAAVGVFGLVSYLVEQRRREFGIRMALGARRADVWRTVIRESLQPAAIGLGAGALGAWALESVVRSSVFGWQASGWMSLAIVAAGLFFVATVAALIPAARAARIDPAVTLKSE